MDIITDEIISILFMCGIHSSSCGEQDYMMTALIVFAEARPQIGEGKGCASTNTVGNLLSPSNPLPPSKLIPILKNIVNMMFVLSACAKRKCAALFLLLKWIGRF